MEDVSNRNELVEILMDFSRQDELIDMIKDEHKRNELINIINNNDDSNYDFIQTMDKDEFIQTTYKDEFIELLEDEGERLKFINSLATVDKSNFKNNSDSDSDSDSDVDLGFIVKAILGAILIGLLARMRHNL